MLNERNELLSEVIEVAQSAGEAVMPFYRSDRLEVSRKADDTPVTRADITAHQLIVTKLEKINNLPILSEEGDIPAYAIRKNWSRYWLTDPLDGTRGFINGLDEFTINIALIENNQPVLGVIYAPVHKTLFFAGQNTGAFVIKTMRATEPTPICAAKRSFNQLRFVVGKYHRLRRIQPVIDEIPQAELLRLNSSLKFTAIAEGKADVYVRFGPISEWDTAAGHCILEAAGGKVVDFNGQSLQYNLGDSLSCPPFLAVGNSAYLDALIKLFKRGESHV